MQASTSTCNKICVICGQDCSNCPRTKDPRGRYYCQPCYERALAAANRCRDRAASNPALEANPLGMMEELSSLEPAATWSCPECNSQLWANTVLCTHCGFDRRNGRVVETRVQPAQEQPRLAESSSVPGLFLSPPGVAAVVAAFFGLLLVASFATPVATQAYLVLDGLFGLVLGVAILFAAFRASVLHGFGLIAFGLLAGFFATAAGSSLVQWTLVLLWVTYVLCVVYGVVQSRHLRWLFAVKFLTGLGAAAAAIAAIAGLAASASIPTCSSIMIPFLGQP